MKKPIICAGLRRSGSTWLFNTLRMILKAENKPYVSKFVAYNTKTNNANIVKMHHFDESIANNADHIFVTIRDFTEVIESCFKRNSLNQGKNLITNDNGKIIDFNNIQDVDAFLEKEKQNYLLWKKKASLILPFHVFENDKKSAIKKICNVIDSKINEDQIFEEVESLKTPLEKCDEETQLWPNHITKDKIDINLNENVLNMIKDKYKDFTKPNLPQRIIDVKNILP